MRFDGGNLRGFTGHEGKLNHLGLYKSMANSTETDGLQNRPNKFFEEVYFQYNETLSEFFVGQPLYLFLTGVWIFLQKALF